MNSKYKKLIKAVLDSGHVQEGRNGSTLVIPSYSFTLDFRRDSSNLTLRKMNYKGVEGEFKTLTDRDNPLTNVQQFKDNGCNYWNKWAEEDGSIKLDYYDKLQEQLWDVIDNIKLDPSSRRHVVSLWDHRIVMNDELSLACCWHGLTFSIINDVIHLTWTQRSCDLLLGVPADIHLAYLFMSLVSERTGFKIGSCMFSLSNVHIYMEHIEGARKLLERTSMDNNVHIGFKLKE